MILDDYPAGGYPEEGWPLPDDVELVENIVVDDEQGLHCDIVRPRTAQRPLPVVVWVHGGGWMWGNRRSAFERLFGLAQKGFVGVAIDYRLSGAATFPAQLEDVRTGLRAVHRFADSWQMDTTKIGLFGGSSGGNLAALTALRAPEAPETSVRSTLVLFPPTDLMTLDADFAPEVTSRLDHSAADSCEGRLVGGVVRDRSEVAASASPLNFVHGDAPPFCILHGTADDIVPVAQSVKLHEALLAAGTDSELHLIDGGGHGAAGWGRDYLTTIADFFGKTLA